MSKYLCVSRKRFEQVLGYSSWSVITITLLIFLSASLIEMDNLYIPINQSQWDIKIWCYDSVLFNERFCGDVFDDDGQQYYTMYTFVIMNLINIAIIGLWIYNKQTKFKFAWCENMPDRREE